MDFTDITVRQLRQLLTEVHNQDMSVRQLRQALFALEDQDTPAVYDLGTPGL